jgi:hypothetical protein
MGVGFLLPVNTPDVGACPCAPTAREHVRVTGAMLVHAERAKHSSDAEVGL